MRSTTFRRSSATCPYPPAAGLEALDDGFDRRGQQDDAIDQGKKSFYVFSAYLLMNIRSLFRAGQEFADALLAPHPIFSSNRRQAI